VTLGNDITSHSRVFIHFDCAHHELPSACERSILQLVPPVVQHELEDPLIDAVVVRSHVFLLKFPCGVVETERESRT
jgi:hypothetical protein